MPMATVRGKRFDRYGHLCDERPVVLYRSNDSDELDIELSNRKATVRIEDLIAGLKEIGVEVHD